MELIHIWSVAPTEEVTVLAGDEHVITIAIENLGPSTDLRIKFSPSGNAVEELAPGAVHVRKGTELTIWNMSPDQHSVGKWGFAPD